MKFYKGDIISAVRTALDEIGLNDAEFATGQDSVELDSVILSKALESADYVHQNADGGLIDHSDCLSVSYPGTSAGTARLSSDNVLLLRLRMLDGSSSSSVLGIDLLRMVYANADMWPYPVTGLVSDTDEEYAQVVNQYVGASVERPAVTLRHWDGGERVETLELRKLSPTALRAVVYLIEKAGWRNDSGGEYVEVNNGVRNAFVYRVAALTAYAFSEQRSQVLDGLCRQELGIESTNQ